MNKILNKICHFGSFGWIEKNVHLLCSSWKNQDLNMGVPFCPNVPFCPIVPFCPNGFLLIYQTKISLYLLKKKLYLYDFIKVSKDLKKSMPLTNKPVKSSFSKHVGLSQILSILPKKCFSKKIQVDLIDVIRANIF